MSKTNCINCGAAKDISEIKCPFCGTTYLDMTAIDFSSSDPVVCQFVLPDHFQVVNKDGKPGKAIMSMLAVPKLEDISMTANTVDVYGGNSPYPSTRFTQSWDMNVGVSFVPVVKENSKTLFEMRAE